MNNVMSILKDTVPISMFDNGQADKIFKEVNKSGTKVVIKNDSPECVLMSPREYEEHMELIEDMLLAAEAMKRLENSSPEDALTEEEMLARLGITEEELTSVEISDDDIA